VYVNTTSDDHYLFVNNEGAQSISVVDLAKARESHFASSSTIVRIPTGISPIALTFSSDERYLFTTSQAKSQAD
jgi:6-phosphogluconolactonase (cycloisomerase 2 family)